MRKHLKQRVLDLYEKTLENGYDLSDNFDIDNIDFYNLYSKAMQYDCAVSFDNDNLFFINHKQNGTSGIIIIYMVNNLDTNKKLSEKIMNLVSILEDLFISLDQTKIITENSATYLVIYKNLSINTIGGIE